MISKEKNLEIRKKAIDTLLSCQTIFLPISPNGIAFQKYGDSIKFETYTHLAKKQNTCIHDIANRLGSIDGVTHKMGDKYLVVYNDYSHYGRIQFTLAHELGHIILGHFLIPESVINGDRSKELEVEANIFASELLAPSSVIGILDGADDKTVHWQTIQKLFCTSEESSKYILNYFYKIHDNEIIDYRKNELLSIIANHFPKSNDFYLCQNIYHKANNSYQNMDKYHVSNIMAKKMFK